MGRGGDLTSILIVVTYFCVTLGRLLESESQLLSVQWAHHLQKLEEEMVQCLCV